MRVIGTIWGALALSGLTCGCESDRILPVDVRCGDGVVSAPDEQCDVEGPGCDACHLVDGYTCPDNVCASVCGDGEVVGDEECDPPDGIRCDQSCREASRSGCDMDGYYVARQTNFSRDTIVGQVQTSTNWYLYRFAQEGDAFAVREVLGCGLMVTGSVVVSLGKESSRAVLYSSHQGPDFVQGPRRGHSKPSGDKCAFDFERWYLVRGTEEQYLPEDFRARPALTSLPPLPKEDDPLNPSSDGPSGATDPDGDGRPGFALRLTGNLPGLRSVVQRDWNECPPVEDQDIVPDAVEFDARSDFDNQENVLSVAECDPAACGLLVAGSAPAQDLPGRMTFRYLGQDPSEPRVSAIVRGAPGSDAEVDLETCALLQAALPGEAASK